jgi:hypothetical protein
MIVEGQGRERSLQARRNVTGGKARRTSSAYGIRMIPEKEEEELPPGNHPMLVRPEK